MSDSENSAKSPATPRQLNSPILAKNGVFPKHVFPENGSPLVHAILSGTHSSALQENYFTDNPFYLCNWQRARGAQRAADGSRRCTYDCSYKDKKNCPVRVLTHSYYHDSDCKLLKSELFTIKGGEPVGQHTHPPPLKLQVSKPSLKRASELMAAGLAPSNATTNVNKEAEHVKDQISNLQARSKKKRDNPDRHLTVDEALTARGVLRAHLTAPSELFVVFSEAQKTLLRTFRGLAFIDSTYKRIKDGWLLTSLLGLAQGMVIPLGWFIHRSPSATTIELCFTFVRKEAPEASFSVFVGDYDDALKKGTLAVYPNARWLGDPFHLLRAGRRYYKDHCASGAERTLHAHLYDTLRILYTSPTVDIFNRNFQTFKVHWQSREPIFWEYFEREWVPKVREWAFYSRPDHIPTGDNVLEGHHNRLRIALGRHKPLLEVVDQLLAIFNDEHAKLLHPDQRGVDHFRGHMYSQTKYQQYLAGRPERPVDLSTYLEACEVEIAPGITSEPSSGATPASQPPPPPVPPVEGGSATCASCNKAAANKACKTKVCSACCIRSGQSCSVFKHKNEKMKLMRPIITQAIEKRARATIRYNGGTHLVRELRKVEPLRWEGEEQTAFVAVCCDQRQERQFLLAKLMHVQIDD